MPYGLVGQAHMARAGTNVLQLGRPAFVDPSCLFSLDMTFRVGSHPWWKMPCAAMQPWLLRVHFRWMDTWPVASRKRPPGAGRMRVRESPASSMPSSPPVRFRMTRGRSNSGREGELRHEGSRSRVRYRLLQIIRPTPDDFAGRHHNAGVKLAARMQRPIESPAMTKVCS